MGSEIRDPVWKRSRSPCLEDMCFTFDSGLGAAKNLPKRTKFTSERRKEVASVRKVGACLRCRLLKVPCSGGRPCGTCARLANGAPMLVYQWMDCVTLSLQELNIFESDVTLLDNIESPPDIPFETILPGSINLDFETLVPWSLGGLTKDFSDWIQQDQEISEISKTGVLSSPRFQKLLARTIGEELSHSLALLVCITSIIFNKGQHTSYIRFPSKDLRIIRARAAKGVLQHLEKALKPAALEKAARSRAQLEALFMLVFGTIIAAGYFQEWKESPQSSEETTKLKDAQEQLVRILAHYLILVMERLALLDPVAEKQRIINEAPVQWKKVPAFRWESRKPFSMPRKEWCETSHHEYHTCRQKDSFNKHDSLARCDRCLSTDSSHDGRIWSFNDQSRALELTGYLSWEPASIEGPECTSPDSDDSAGSGICLTCDRQTAGEAYCSTNCRLSASERSANRFENSELFLPGPADPWLNSWPLTSPKYLDESSTCTTSSAPLTCPEAGCGLPLIPPLACLCGYQPEAENLLFNYVDWNETEKGCHDSEPCCEEGTTYPMCRSYDQLPGVNTTLPMRRVDDDLTYTKVSKYPHSHATAMLLPCAKAPQMPHLVTGEALMV